MPTAASTETRLAAAMTAWRRDIHRHSELGYHEHRTAEKVASLL